MDVSEKVFLIVLGLGAVTAIALAPFFGILPALAWLLALAMLVYASKLLKKLTGKRGDDRDTEDQERQDGPR